MPQSAAPDGAIRAGPINEEHRFAGFWQELADIVRASLVR
jgi:hypothetical protein